MKIILKISTHAENKEATIFLSLHFHGGSVDSVEFCFMVQLVDLSVPLSMSVRNSVSCHHFTEALHGIILLLPVLGFLSASDAPQTFLMQLFDGKLTSVSPYRHGTLIMTLP
jgi:hypothetical protein